MYITRNYRVFNPFLNVELCCRTKNASFTKNSKLYYIWFMGRIIGYLILDIWEKRKYVCLYEIYIIKDKRGNRIGTKTITWVIRYCKRHKNKLLILSPQIIDENKKLEQKVREDRLENWYKSFGFTNNPEIPGEMILKL